MRPKQSKMKEKRPERSWSWVMKVDRHVVYVVTRCQLSNMADSEYKPLGMI
jgi:hypothetical protein